MSPRATPPADVLVTIRISDADAALIDQISRAHHIPVDRLLAGVVREFSDQQRARLRGIASNTARARAAAPRETR